MFKKVITLLLVVVLTAAIAIGGTLAYLTDRDSEANVFTVGNVSIDLLEDFSQGSALVPGVGIEKKPSIKNTGINDAWVWASVAVPAELADYISVSGKTKDWDWDTVDATDTTIGGLSYKLYTALHNSVLETGKETSVIMDKVTLDSAVDIDPKGDWYSVENGVATSLGWNNSKGNPVIYVSAYAAQKEGFNNVEAAYNAYGRQWGDNGSEYGKVYDSYVSTADDFAAALAAGETVSLSDDIVVTDTINIEEATEIDLNGHTLTVSRLEAKADTTIIGGEIVHGKCTYPAVSVSEGTLKMENVKITSEEYCNLVTSGSAEAAEYTGIEVWSGKLILDNCDIRVATDKIRYSNSIFGIGVHGGEVTMNGGSITIENHGSTKPQYNYEAAIFAGSNTEKVINMNGVSISMGENASYLYAWGGNTVLNTTDNVADEDVNTRNGGTYVIK